MTPKMFRKRWSNLVVAEKNIDNLEVCMLVMAPKTNQLSRLPDIVYQTETRALEEVPSEAAAEQTGPKEGA